MSHHKPIPRKVTSLFDSLAPAIWGRDSNDSLYDTDKIISLLNTYSYKEMQKKANKIGIDSRLSKHALAVSLSLGKNVFFPDQIGNYLHDTLQHFILQFKIVTHSDQMSIGLSRAKLKDARNSTLREILLTVWKGGNVNELHQNMNETIRLGDMILEAEKQMCPDYVQTILKKKNGDNKSILDTLKQAVTDIRNENDKWMRTTDIIMKRAIYIHLIKLRDRAERLFVQYIRIVKDFCKNIKYTRCNPDKLPKKLKEWMDDKTIIGAEKIVLCNVRVKGKTDIDFKVGSRFLGDYYIDRVIVTQAKSRNKSENIPESKQHTIWLGITKMSGPSLYDSKKKEEEEDKKKDDELKKERPTNPFTHNNNNTNNTSSASTVQQQNATTNTNTIIIPLPVFNAGRQQEPMKEAFKEKPFLTNPSGGISSRPTFSSSSSSQPPDDPGKASLFERFKAGLYSWGRNRAKDFALSAVGFGAQKLIEKLNAPSASVIPYRDYVREILLEDYINKLRIPAVKEEEIMEQGEKGSEKEFEKDTIPASVKLSGQNYILVPWKNWVGESLVMEKLEWAKIQNAIWEEADRARRRAYEKYVSDQEKLQAKLQSQQDEKSRQRRQQEIDSDVYEFVRKQEKINKDAADQLERQLEEKSIKQKANFKNDEEKRKQWDAFEREKQQKIRDDLQSQRSRLLKAGKDLKEATRLKMEADELQWRESQQEKAREAQEKGREAQEELQRRQAQEELQGRQIENEQVITLPPLPIEQKEPSRNQEPGAIFAQGQYQARYLSRERQEQLKVMIKADQERQRQQKLLMTQAIQPYYPPSIIERFAQTLRQKLNRRDEKVKQDMERLQKERIEMIARAGDRYKKPIPVQTMQQSISEYIKRKGPLPITIGKSHSIPSTLISSILPPNENPFPANIPPPFSTEGTIMNATVSIFKSPLPFVPDVLVDANNHPKVIKLPYSINPHGNSSHVVPALVAQDAFLNMVAKRYPLIPSEDISTFTTRMAESVLSEQSKQKHNTELNVFYQVGNIQALAAHLLAFHVFDFYKIIYIPQIRRFAFIFVNPSQTKTISTELITYSSAPSNATYLAEQLPISPTLSTNATSSDSVLFGSINEAKDASNQSSVEISMVIGQRSLPVTLLGLWGYVLSHVPDAKLYLKESIEYARKTAKEILQATFPTNQTNVLSNTLSNTLYNKIEAGLKDVLVGLNIKPNIIQNYLPDMIQLGMVSSSVSQYNTAQIQTRFNITPSSIVLNRDGRAEYTEIFSQQIEIGTNMAEDLFNELMKRDDLASSLKQLSPWIRPILSDPERILGLYKFTEFLLSGTNNDNILHLSTVIVEATRSQSTQISKPIYPPTDISIEEFGEAITFSRFIAASLMSNPMLAFLKMREMVYRAFIDVKQKEVSTVDVWTGVGRSLVFNTLNAVSKMARLDIVDENLHPSLYNRSQNAIQAAFLIDGVLNQIVDAKPPIHFMDIPFDDSEMSKTVSAELENEQPLSWSPITYKAFDIINPLNTKDWQLMYAEKDKNVLDAFYNFLRLLSITCNQTDNYVEADFWRDAASTYEINLPSERIHYNKVQSDIQKQQSSPGWIGYVSNIIPRYIESSLIPIVYDFMVFSPKWEGYVEKRGILEDPLVQALALEEQSFLTNAQNIKWSQEWNNRWDVIEERVVSTAITGIKFYVLTKYTKGALALRLFKQTASLLFSSNQGEDFKMMREELIDPFLNKIGIDTKALTDLVDFVESLNANLIEQYGSAYLIALGLLEIGIETSLNFCFNGFNIAVTFKPEQVQQIKDFSRDTRLYGMALSSPLQSQFGTLSKSLGLERTKQLFRAAEEQGHLDLLSMLQQQMQRNSQQVSLMVNEMLTQNIEDLLRLNQMQQIVMQAFGSVVKETSSVIDMASRSQGMQELLNRVQNIV